MADESDMFRDLEETLCEGLNELCFTRTNQSVTDVTSEDNDDPSDIDLDCLEDTENLGQISGPAIRGSIC